MCWQSVPPSAGLDSSTRLDSDASVGGECSSAMWVGCSEAARMEWRDVVSRLSSDVTRGLSESEVQLRRRTVGYNQFTETQEDPLWKKYLGQFKEPLILLLLVSAGVSVAMQQLDDAVVITLAIIIVATVAFVQEMRTDKALEELKKQVPATCMCLREGAVREYQARELVPGDVVHLGIGDRVPSDVRLFQALQLCVDESSFTGETEPAEKSADVFTGGPLNGTNGGLPDGNSSSSLSNIVYMGTFVRTGRGKGIVINTGERSQFGKLFRLMQEEEAPRTPLQLNMDKLAKKLSIFSFAFIALVFCLGLYQGIPLQKIFNTTNVDVLQIFNIAVSLAVAAIPEGLPIVVTMTLCLGIRRMAQRSALVKGLHTVETLGCVTTICSDKTGTLTKNEMTATWLCTSERDECSFSGVGYEISGGSTLDYTTGYSQKAYDAVYKLLETGLLCNNAQLVAGQLLGQPTEGALLVAALKFGLFGAADKYMRLEELPFSSETKKMAVKIQNSETGVVEWLAKGGVEVMMADCSHYQQGSSSLPLSPNAKATILNSAKEQARHGLRVVCLARGSSLQSLVYQGLVGLQDPPREGVSAALDTLYSTGVNVKMVTGDAMETACAVAKAIGMQVSPGGVFSGNHLDSVDDHQLAAIMREATVFYRVAPRHKLRIVKALQSSGDVVGMTGDGVNDVVALKRANIGIAMGKMGSAVSKEAADMILNDDNFATILAAIEEGKCIFHNISNFVQFQVSTSIVALSLIALSTLFGLPSPLNPMQILLINVIMDGPPALTLGMEPIDDDIAKQPPRDTSKDLITPRLIRNCLISAAVIIIGTLWVFRSEMLDGVVTARDTTMTFSCFVLFDMFNAMSCRSSTKSIFELGILSNWYLFIALSATLACLLAVVYLPFLQWVFQTEALRLSDWLYLVCLTSSVLIVSEVRKMLSKIRHTRLRRGVSKRSGDKRYLGLPAVASGGSRSKETVLYGLEDV
ncbi:P-type ATPase [Trinorchestia longiramus]|nr:P-type ATPase [Trinorchestia longiramus]